MREIKFRGMDVNGVMRYGQLSQDRPNSTAYYDRCSQRICWDNNNIPVTNESLSQFTGLLDHNGKEIYEGDIVEWKYLKTWHKNEVRWVGGGFVVTTSGFKDDLNEPQDLSLVSILSCEIIGNIYSTPELLHSDK